MRTQRPKRSAPTAPSSKVPVLRSVLRALPDATPVFLGNSLAVRFAEWFAGA